MGAHAPGQEQAPRALRDAGIAAGCADLGDTTLRRWAPDREHRRAQNAAAVVEAAGEVARAKVETALRDGRRALVLGGDCTVELGVVAGALRPARAGRARLLRHAPRPEHARDGADRDARLDGRRAHARARRHRPAVAGLGPRTPLLAPADVVLLAADPDQTQPAERRAIEEHGIRAIAMAEVIADPRAAASRALDLLDHDHLLVHFDVDVVDFVDLPLSENTGLNIGMPFAAARAVLDVLAADPRVATLTVTEHNPAHGAADGSTTAALAEALAMA